MLSKHKVLYIVFTLTASFMINYFTGFTLFGKKTSETYQHFRFLKIQPGKLSVYLTSISLNDGSKTQKNIHSTYDMTKNLISAAPIDNEQHAFQYRFHKFIKDCYLLEIYPSNILNQSMFVVCQGVVD